jgi:hypothetical protein
MSTRRVIPCSLALAAAIAGAVAAWHYHRLGLTLTHYDARGHLVVARRIADSITPGWQQIGAVWLPLPHLLNAVPVQMDLFYRSGLSAVALSVMAFSVATGSIAAIVLALTGSPLAAVAAAAVFALNPNVLYLQSTPMTEPLLIALTTLGVAMLIDVLDRASDAGGHLYVADRLISISGGPISMEGRASSAPTGVGAAGIGCTFALACMTRYEAWPAAACALAAGAWTRWRRGTAWPAAWRGIARIGLYPVVAVLGFLVFSRVVIGEWLVASGFFVPENKALHDLSLAAKEVGWGTRALSGPLLVWIGGAGAASLAALGLVHRRRSDALIALSLVATAAIPWMAFYKGHPFRIRYMLPLIAMEAVGAGFVAGMLRRGRPIAASAVLLAVALELRPFDGSAPMVLEAQWDRPNAPVRARVTACLDGPGSGGKIMASMGSLGHYMQEASAQGYALRDFLHEGNGDIWLAALDNPRPFAEWVLVEEKAEGGDMLARLSQERPAFLNGYSRVCEGAGLALYKRQPFR